MVIAPWPLVLSGWSVDRAACNSTSKVDADALSSGCEPGKYPGLDSRLSQVGFNGHACLIDHGPLMVTELFYSI